MVDFKQFEIKFLSGTKVFPAGRINEGPSIGLSESLRSVGFKLGRLQTGTPARLDARTINFEKTEKIAGDTLPKPFSFLNDRVDNAVSKLSDMLCTTYPFFLG